MKIGDKYKIYEEIIRIVLIQIFSNIGIKKVHISEGSWYDQRHKSCYGVQRLVWNKTLLWDASNGGTGAFPLTPGREPPHIKNNKLRDYRKHGTHYVYAAISISAPLSRPLSLSWGTRRCNAHVIFFHQFRPDRRVLKYNVGGRCPTRIVFLSYIVLQLRICWLIDYYDELRLCFVKMTYRV